MTSLVLFCVPDSPPPLVYVEKIRSLGTRLCCSMWAHDCTYMNERLNSHGVDIHLPHGTAMYLLFAHQRTVSYIYICGNTGRFYNTGHELVFEAMAIRPYYLAHRCGTRSYLHVPTKGFYSCRHIAGYGIWVWVIVEWGWWWKGVIGQQIQSILC